MKRSRSTPSGFTLIELLVLLAIIAVLSAIMIPAFNSGREMVNRAQCASNLRQIAVATHLYAQENDKALPDKAGVGLWPWDTRLLVLDQLMATRALTLETFYCPSGTWDADNTGSEGEWEWHFGFHNPETTFSIITYVLIFDNSPGIPQQYWNPRLGDQTITLGGRNPVAVDIPESERVLAVDAVMSIGSSADASFMGIMGGSPEPHRTNHMKGDRPAGGNVLYLDGAVEWRSFADMAFRVTAGPSWWW